MHDDKIGVRCQICGAIMIAKKYPANKRRWRFVCPECGARGPARNGRGQAAAAAKTYDAIAYSLRKPIICPFYRYSERQKIACEALADGANRTEAHFLTRKARIVYMAMHCRSMYTQCKIAQKCMEKAPGD